MGKSKVTVTVTPAGAGAYQVAVRQGSTSTEHQVTVPDGTPGKLGLSSVAEATLVEESFDFLLEREPATSILRQLDLPVISQYFPDYDQEMLRRLG